MANRTLRLSRQRVAEPETNPTTDGAVIDEPTSIVDEPIEYSATDSSDFVAPGSAELPADEPTGEQPGKRKRGRPAGSRNGTSSKRSDSQNDKEAPQNIGDLLYSVHYMLARVCNSELLELDEEEAQKMGAAVARVNKHSNRMLSPKQLAWFNLMTVAGTVYGTRLVAFAQNSKAKKNKGKIEIINPPASVASQSKPPVTIDAE